MARVDSAVFALTLHFNNEMKVKNLCDRIDEHIASHPRESMDLGFDVVEAVADNITQIVLGAKFNKQQLNFMIERLRGLEKVPATFFLMNAFPFIVQLLKFKFVEKIVGIQQIKNIRLPLEDMVMKYVKEHKDSYTKDNISDFMYSYIEEQSTHQDSETDKYWWDDDQIKHACTELLVAGMGTTEATVTWSLMLMGNNPELQKKVHEEIQNVIGLERLPSTRDLQSLPLCEASILEILRWSVVAPTGIPHAVTQDCEFEGYFIPKDTSVLANLYAVSRDKKVWLDPENFNPEANFLSADKSQIINRDKMIPFGVGRRSCIGESLARMEITLFFLGIFQKFDVSIDPKYGLPKPSTGLFRAPSHRKIKFHHYRTSVSA